MDQEPKTILLVEDNPDHAELIMRSLKGLQAPHRVVHLQDGEAALDYLFARGIHSDRTQFPLPRLILLDLQLPKFNGMQILKEIKATVGLRSIPVVILSSSDADRDLEAAYRYHANSFLTKPLEYGDFSRMLRDLGVYWLDCNRLPLC